MTCWNRSTLKNHEKWALIGKELLGTFRNGGCLATYSVKCHPIWPCRPPVASTKNPSTKIIPRAHSTVKSMFTKGTFSKDLTTNGTLRSRSIPKFPIIPPPRSRRSTCPPRYNTAPGLPICYQSDPETLLAAETVRDKDRVEDHLQIQTWSYPPRISRRASAKGVEKMQLKGSHFV